MDFAFLLDRRRKILSIGYDAKPARSTLRVMTCWLRRPASPTSLRLPKAEIPQESWFLLSRSHVVAYGRPVLISWTGTMFEYLMPSLWMRSYPDTLLERRQGSLGAETQQDTPRRNMSRGGISECAYAQDR